MIRSRSRVNSVLNSSRSGAAAVPVLIFRLPYTCSSESTGSRDDTGSWELLAFMWHGRPARAGFGKKSHGQGKPKVARGAGLGKKIAHIEMDGLPRRVEITKSSENHRLRPGPLLAEGAK